MESFQTINIVFGCLWLLLFIFCMIIHWRNHFITKCCCCIIKNFNDNNNGKIIHNSNEFEIKMMNETMKCRYYCCIFKSPTFKKHPDYDFFPQLFLVYIIFTLIVSILIFINYIIYVTNNELNNDRTCNIYALFTDVKMFYNFNSILNNNNNDFIFQFILGILIYISIITESFFYFWRYIPVSNAINNIQQTSSVFAFKKYLQIYCIWFTILYYVSIYIYYPMFPIIIISNVIFNSLCTYFFASSLKSQYLGLDGIY